ncbi:MAG: UvrD-helicase domain-containing protein [Acholeplasma sp.]|nr:UvrD-helicase domain-containing protein [Acholeplasma sp.]
MNSKIIKFVAGAGKTTYSRRLMTRAQNGLYLAFTNSVIDDMNKYPFIARTIDSLFISFIIPKFVKLIPIISSSSNIIFSDSQSENMDALFASNIVISPNGDLLNRSKKITEISLFTKNKDLHSMRYFQNSRSIKYIFDQEITRFTHLQRTQISRYIIVNYPSELVAILQKRFQFIIIDEAQDISDYREDFCKLLFESNIKVRLLGDDNQNINGGGKWFETLEADKIKNVTYRCPDEICNWIRTNLNIEIFGNANIATFNNIDIDDLAILDDGKRVLLYKGRFAKINSLIDGWSGRIITIQSAKGMTINDDIVIVGESLNKKFYYTAITRTTKSVYSTIKKIN